MPNEAMQRVWGGGRWREKQEATGCCEKAWFVLQGSDDPDLILRECSI